MEITINGKKIEYHAGGIERSKDRILKSGIFKLDQSDNPIGIIKLTSTKTLSKRKKNTLEMKDKIGIKDFPIEKVQTNNEGNLEAFLLKQKTYQYLFDLAKELNDAISRVYGAGQTSIEDIAIKEAHEDFEQYLSSLLKECELTEAQLGKPLTDFRKRAKKEVRIAITKSNIYKNLNRKGRNSLILPLFKIFGKYLPPPVANSKVDLFHYIAHLLIGLGIAHSDKQKGHELLFNSIKRYYYRPH